MKTNCWLVLGAMLATSAIAQNNTNTLPEMPAPVSSPTAEAAAPAPAATPAAKPAKPAAKHKARTAVPKKMSEPTVALVPGPAEVVVSNLIVRGQAGLKGEVVAHLFKGDAVTVLGQINLDKHAADEPAQWAKIALPSTVHVWLNSRYIDKSSKVVSAKKLNLRVGPGENFSVVGILEKGMPVNEIETKGDWIKIEAPGNSYAFIAAMYLKQEAVAPVVATPAPTPTPVPEAQPIVTEPVNPPPVAATAPAAIEANVPPPPRVATHEGVVRHVGSLITPTEYELYDPTTDKNVDFLYATTTNLDLSHYVGMRIIVTGEEGLAARWPDIPVLTVQRITVVDPNAVPQRIYRSPRQSQGR